MIVLLSGITLIVAGVLGLITALAFGGSVGGQIWVSLMHALDAGTLAGDGLDNIPFLILMTIATLCGLFITSILDDEGSEIYMKPALLYVKADVPVDFHTVTEAAARRNEIAVGYKKVDSLTGRQTIVTNPDKREKCVFTESDSMIVIAED